MSDFKTAYELLKEKENGHEVENEKIGEGVPSQSLLLRRGVDSNLETSVEGDEQ